MPTKTEEDYLKAVFKITERSQSSASTNSIADHLSTAPASVTDMVKKLDKKGLVVYQKYKGVYLSESGKKIATQLIRKHRLWEVFLHDKLKFPWEQIHEIAEDLEHIDSADLINRLDNFLGNPRFDPHGDPIPNAEGKFMLRKQCTLDELVKGQRCVLVGVSEHSVSFLQYLNDFKIKLGTQFQILDVQPFDKVMIVKKDEEPKSITLGHRVTKNLLVKIV